MRAALAALALLALAGCASEQKYREHTNSFLGVSVKDLQKTWGRPHGAFVLNGNEVLIYHNGKELGPERCTNYFEVKDGKVVGVGYKGDNCRK